jgi:predicted transcriptional regulator
MSFDAVNRMPPDEVVNLGLEIIGRGVLRARLNLRLTQGGLERWSGVDQSTISRLEHGTLRGLRLRRLAALAAALNGFPIIDDRSEEELRRRLLIRADMRQQ